METWKSHLMKQYQLRWKALLWVSKKYETTRSAEPNACECVWIRRGLPLVLLVSCVLTRLGKGIKKEKIRNITVDNLGSNTPTTLFILDYQFRLFKAPIIRGF